MRDFLLIIALIAATPASFVNPYFGVLAWTIISYLNPHQFAWGLARSLPVALAIAIPTLIGLVFTRRRQMPPVNRETVLLTALWIWFGVTTVSVFFSEQFVAHIDDTTARLWVVSKILLMSYVSMALVTTRDRFRWWYLVTAAVFGFFFVKATVFGIATAGQFRVYGPDNSLIGDNNDFALAANMCLPLFVYLLARDRSRWIRRLGWVAFACGVFAVLLTYSRGGLLGLVAILLVMGFKSRHKLLTGVSVAALGIAVLSFAPQGWLDRMSTIETATKEDASLHARFRSWHLATRIAIDHPVVGGGFETFTDDLFNYYDLPGEKAWGAHSIYFQTLAEHGFVGLFLFLALLAGSWCSARRLSRAYRGIERCEMYSNAGNALQVSLVAFASSGALLGRANFDLYYQVIAMIIVAQALARRQVRALSGAAASPEITADEGTRSAFGSQGRQRPVSARV